MTHEIDIEAMEIEGLEGYIRFAQGFYEQCKEDAAKSRPEISKDSEPQNAWDTLDRWYKAKQSAIDWATIPFYYAHEGLSFDNLSSILCLDDDAERRWFHGFRKEIEAFDYEAEREKLLGPRFNAARGKKK